VHCIACATSTVRVPSTPVLRYTGRSPASACTPSSSSLTAPLLPASATSIPRHSRVQPAPVGIQPSKPRIVGTRPVLVSVGFVGPLASWGVWALAPLPRRLILVIPLPLHYWGPSHRPDGQYNNYTLPSSPCLAGPPGPALSNSSPNIANPVTSLHQLHHLFLRHLRQLQRVVTRHRRRRSPTPDHPPEPPSPSSPARHPPAAPRSPPASDRPSRPRHPAQRPPTPRHPQRPPSRCQPATQRRP